MPEQYLARKDDCTCLPGHKKKTKKNTKHYIWKKACGNSRKPFLESSGHVLQSLPSPSPGGWTLKRRTYENVRRDKGKRVEMLSVGDLGA